MRAQDVIAGGLEPLSGDPLYEGDHRPGALTNPSKAAYCQRWGHEFECAEGTLDASRPPAWSKVLHIRRLLDVHDWVFWLDADALVTNPEIAVSGFLDHRYNVIKLVRRPTVSASTRYSYPLLLYGTVWYKYVDFENNFRGCLTGWRAIGSAIYLLALPLTLAALAGVVSSLWRGFSGIFGALRGAPAGGALQPESDFVFHSMLTLVFSVALVMSAGVLFDAWSCFQSRLFFAAFFPVMLAAGIGLDMATAASRSIGRLHAVSNAALLLLCALYFAVEVALLLPGSFATALWA